MWRCRLPIHSVCGQNCRPVRQFGSKRAGLITQPARGYRPQLESFPFSLTQATILCLQLGFWFLPGVLHQNLTRIDEASTWRVFQSSGWGWGPFNGIMICTDCEFLPLEIGAQEEDGPITGRYIHDSSSRYFSGRIGRSGPIPKWLLRSLWLILHQHTVAFFIAQFSF